MVQQCDDCKLWFRTEDKFRNHKSGSLGLSCSSGNAKTEPKQPANDEFVISPTKASDVDDDLNDTLLDMDDTIISDDEDDTDLDNSTVGVNDNVISSDEEEDPETTNSFDNKIINAPINISDDSNDMGESVTNTVQNLDNRRDVNDKASQEKEEDPATTNSFDNKIIKAAIDISDDSNDMSESVLDTVENFLDEQIESQTFEITPMMGDTDNSDTGNQDKEKDEPQSELPEKVDENTGADAPIVSEDKAEPQQKTDSVKDILPLKVSTFDNTKDANVNGKDNIEPQHPVKVSVSTPGEVDPIKDLYNVKRISVKSPGGETVPIQIETVLSDTTVISSSQNLKDNEEIEDQVSSTTPEEPKEPQGNTENVQNDEISSTQSCVETQKNVEEKKEDSIMLSDDEMPEEDDFIREQKKTESPQGAFTLVCLHLDTFTISNESTFTISQIGLSTALTGDKEQTYFKPVKPDKLKFLLENYKMEGDLLKALHVTESENEKFEFRAQFEIKRKEKNKIYCSSEAEAITEVKTYFSSLNNVVLFAIDQETIEHFLAKVNLDKSKFAGFLTWSKALQVCSKYLKQYDPKADLEDFYSDHCGKVSGYINALDVAQFLRKSVMKLLNDYSKTLSKKDGTGINFQWQEVFKDTVETIDNIKQVDVKPSTKDNGSLSVEVYSSFRPSVSTKIGLEKMETLQLSSGDEKEDSDIDVVQEKVKPKPKLNQDLLRQRLKRVPFLESVRAEMQKRKVRITENEHFRKTYVPARPPLPPARHVRPMAKNQAARSNPSSKPKSSSSVAIVISSSESETSDTDDEEVDHQQVVKNLRKRKHLQVFEKDLKKSLSSVSRAPPPKKPRRGKPVAFAPNCALCNVEFGNMQSLQMHIKMMHLRCNECNIQFEVLAVANAHKSLHEAHKIDEKLLQERAELMNIAIPLSELTGQL